MEFHAAKTGHVNFDESTEEVKALTEEEKKQRALEYGDNKRFIETSNFTQIRTSELLINKLLINLIRLERKWQQKQKDREEEAKKEEIEREKKRREMGQNMAIQKQKSAVMMMMTYIYIRMLSFFIWTIASLSHADSKKRK